MCFLNFIHSLKQYDCCPLKRKCFAEQEQLFASSSNPLRLPTAMWYFRNSWMNDMLWLGLFGTEDLNKRLVKNGLYIYIYMYNNRTSYSSCRKKRTMQMVTAPFWTLWPYGISPHHLSWCFRRLFFPAPKTTFQPRSKTHLVDFFRNCWLARINWQC